jgi:putative hemolysin
LIVGLCMILGGLCAAVDGALRALGEVRVRAARESAPPRARVAQRYLDQHRVIHARLLAGRIVLLTLAAALATFLGAALYGMVGAACAAGTVSLVYGMIAEAATRFATRRATGIALPMLERIHLVELMFAPFAAPLLWAGSLVDRWFPPRPEDNPGRVTEADVEQLIEQGEEVGSITQDHATMLRAVLDFQDMTSREIMVPRTQMVAFEVSTPPAKVIEMIIESGHSRYPVYRDRADHVIGVLYAKDLFRVMREEARDFRLADLVRKDVFFVAERHKVGALLKEMQARRVHLAIVTDEFGGTAGLITLEDILEEIVGDIQDEHDREEPELRPIGMGRYEADASVSLHDVEAAVGVSLRPADSGAESLGGLLVETAGRVPAPGERIDLNGFTFTVLDSDARRIERVAIARAGSSTDAAE